MKGDSLGKASLHLEACQSGKIMQDKNRLLLLDWKLGRRLGAGVTG